MHSAIVLAAGSFSMGGYVSIIKIIPVILLFLLWARLLTWADKDAVAAQLPREYLNTGFFIAAMGSLILFFFMPSFLIGFVLIFMVFLGETGTYLYLRNQKVGLADLKEEIKNIGKNLGKKKGAKVKTGEVQFTNSKNKIVSVPDPEAPERVGYDAAQDFVTDPIRKNAEKVTVRPADGGASVNFSVDGVAYAAPPPPMDRNTAAAGITFMKQCAGLEVEDRRKPQTGSMRAMLDGKRHEIEVTTAGTTAGESMQIVFNPKTRFEHRLDTIGLQPNQMAQVQAVLAEPQGIVLVSAPRQQGQTTMLYSLVRAHDAFLLHIQTVERSPREDLEGIAQNKLAPGATPNDEFKLVEWVVSQQPDIIMIDELVNPASAKSLIGFARDGKRVYLGMRSGSTFDSITEWRKLVGDDELAMSALRAAFSGRIMRRLCMACKAAFQPDPEYLRKLNLDPARVQKLFQARTSPLKDPKGNPIPCEFCHDLRYKGRFGVFELFNIDDEVRQTVLSGGSMNQVKTVFRKQRGQYLQEAALAQVVAGETSVQEVLRVMRGGEPQAGARPQQAAAPQAKAPSRR